MDKRTKEYKKWKAKSKGLGDTIEKITKATGIKKVVDWFNKVTGLDCGCDERKKVLNKLYRYKAECLNEKEYTWLTDYFKRHKPNNYTKKDHAAIKVIYQRVFRVTMPSLCTGCNGSIKVMQDAVKHLRNVYNSYN